MVIMDVTYETLRCIVGPTIEFFGRGKNVDFGRGKQIVKASKKH